MSILRIFHSINFRFQRVIRTDEHTILGDIGDLSPHSIEFGQTRMSVARIEGKPLIVTLETKRTLVIVRSLVELTRWCDAQDGVSFNVEDQRHFVNLMAVGMFIFIVGRNE